MKEASLFDPINYGCDLRLLEYYDNKVIVAEMAGPLHEHTKRAFERSL